MPATTEAPSQAYRHFYPGDVPWCSHPGCPRGASAIQRLSAGSWEPRCGEHYDQDKPTKYVHVTCDACGRCPVCDEPSNCGGCN